MSLAIAVENLSKKYIIGHQKKERYTALHTAQADVERLYARWAELDEKRAQAIGSTQS